MSAIRIRAVVYQERDMWCAQCLEHDIAVQALTSDELRRELAATLLAYIRIGLKEECDPLAGIPPAPPQFEEMWNASQYPIEEEKPIIASVQDIASAPSIVPEIRFVSSSLAFSGA